MGSIERKRQLFDDIVRLRRVGRELPGNPDVAAVRARLEADLGETVSRRMAARVLGVSHTALQRWIERGDLSVVYTPDGRLDVPLPALLDLYEAVAQECSGTHPRYVLAPTMARQREAARRLPLAADRAASGARTGHDRARGRGLAYHRAVAHKLTSPMVAEARHVLFRWRTQGRIDERYADRWEDLLGRPLAEIRRGLIDPSQEADDLRQNSPLAGLLSEPQRRRIVAEIK